MFAPTRHSSWLLLLTLAGILLAGAGCRTTDDAPATSPPAPAQPTATRTLATIDAGHTPSPTLSPAPTRRPRSAASPAPAGAVPHPATAPPTIPPSPATATVLPSPSPTPTYAIHTVQEAETLLGIAAGYGLTLEALLQANEVENPNLLAPGQQLQIPPATGANALPALPTRDYGYAVVGYSSQGRVIEAFSFGQGETQIVLVGGMHGGYEWNTVALAYEVIDYFYGNQAQIPASVTLHIIPAANPDGLYLVTGREGRFSPARVGDPPRAARFNGRGVDLNRNWSCGWTPGARWGGTAVDPGPEPFSEPETRALRAYFRDLQPAAVILWHSQANLVAPGLCGGDAGSDELAAIYARASGYPHRNFTAYELSGTASDWLNEQGIPAAAVELVDHERTASGQNLAGIFALFDHYGAVPAAGE